MERDRQLLRGSGDEWDGGGLELEDQDSDETRLWVQACWLSPEHHISHRRSVKFKFPKLNEREPII